jgi:predicted ATP-grasp superfamily ATP-dependent carboligase
MSQPLRIVPDVAPRPLRILILDGQYVHALTAVRSLGRRGAHVAVAAHKPHAMCFKSRWCHDRILAPNSNEEPQAWVSWLFETLRRGSYDATLFFGESTAELLSQHRDRIQKWTGCPLPSRDIFLTADRKDRAARLASQLGVPVPATHELEHLEDCERLAGQLDFPVVVKGVYSSGSQQVAVVRDPSQLAATVQRIAALRRSPALPLPLVQEWVPGRGYGLTALMRRGEPVATFMHRRLGEHDISAGVRFAHGAAGAQSVFEPELQHHGLTLLQALCWDGIAMVEFRRSRRDGRFYLMEINPRFVGSLDLAVAAGMDLPWLYAQLAAGRPVVGPNRYRVGLRYRWLLSKNVAGFFENPLGTAWGALSVLRPDTRCDLSLRDPGPHWSHLRDALYWVRRKRSGGAGRPAGAAPAPAAAPSGELPGEAAARAMIASRR